MHQYKVHYQDKYGSEDTYFESNGSHLKISIRDIVFEGRGFDDFEPNVRNDLEGKFDFDKFDCLINFKMVVSMPIYIKIHKNLKTSNLKFTCKYYEGDPCSLFSNFSITVENIEYFSAIEHRTVMEDALIKLQNTLPVEMDIISCVSCKYTNYSPCGTSEFGAIICLGNFKEQAKKIKHKGDLLDFMEYLSKNDLYKFVQETFYCNKYEQLTLEDWNYSDWEHRVLKKDEKNSN